MLYSVFQKDISATILWFWPRLMYSQNIFLVEAHNIWPVYIWLWRRAIHLKHEALRMPLNKNYYFLGVEVALQLFINYFLMWDMCSLQSVHNECPRYIFVALIANRMWYIDVHCTLIYNAYSIVPIGFILRNKLNDNLFRSFMYLQA